MSDKPSITLHVTAERSGDEPRPWAWSVYNERPEMLIARSRAEFSERDQALNAGRAAAIAVRRRLELARSRELPAT